MQVKRGRKFLSESYRETSCLEWSATLAGPGDTGRQVVAMTAQLSVERARGPEEVAEAGLFAVPDLADTGLTGRTTVLDTGAVDAKFPLQLPADAGLGRAPVETAPPAWVKPRESAFMSPNARADIGRLPLAMRVPATAGRVLWGRAR